MPRAKRGFKRRRRVKKILDKAEGFYSRRKNTLRKGAEAVDRAFRNSWGDRRKKKGNFRELWVARLSAACQMNDLSYSRFMGAMKKANVEVNRKMLSEIAIREPNAFGFIVKEVRSHAPIH